MTSNNGLLPLFFKVNQNPWNKNRNELINHGSFHDQKTKQNAFSLLEGSLLRTQTRRSSFRICDHQSTNRGNQLTAHVLGQILWLTHRWPLKRYRLCENRQKTKDQLGMNGGWHVFIIRTVIFYDFTQFCSKKSCTVPPEARIWPDFASNCWKNRTRSSLCSLGEFRMFWEGGTCRKNR